MAMVTFLQSILETKLLRFDSTLTVSINVSRATVWDSFQFIQAWDLDKILWSWGLLLALLIIAQHGYVLPGMWVGCRLADWVEKIVNSSQRHGTVKSLKRGVVHPLLKNSP